MGDLASLGGEQIEGCEDGVTVTDVRDEDGTTHYYVTGRSRDHLADSLADAETWAREEYPATEDAS